VEEDANLHWACLGDGICGLEAAWAAL